ncbi:hypothetical protein L195_g050555, partial [Trifolium pratense]
MLRGKAETLLSKEKQKLKEVANPSRA